MTVLRNQDNRYSRMSVLLSLGTVIAATVIMVPVTVAQEAEQTTEHVKAEPAAPETGAPPPIQGTTSSKESSESAQAPELSEQPEGDIAETGITTVHLPEPQGNWLFKRLWWEQALQRYEKIREYVDAVLDARPEFFVKRADIDKTILAPFYMAIGLDQGELKRLTVELLDYIEQQRHKTYLTGQERVKLQQLEDAEKELKRVKADVEMMGTIYDRMNEDINVLFGQIKQVRDYDQKAWENFKKIADIVSDTEARTLYYEMGKLKNSIIAIHQYIQREFSKHFNDLVVKITAKTESIEDILRVLKNNGFDIQEQRDLLYQKAVPCDIIPAQEQEPIEVEEERGFFYTYLVGPVYNVISYVGSGLSSLYKWIAGESTQETDTDGQDMGQDTSQDTELLPGNNSGNNKDTRAHNYPEAPKNGDQHEQD